MTKYLFIILVISQFSVYGQPFIKEKVINYEDVIEELKSTKNIKSLENKYDYTALLLLDSTQIKLIEKTGYQYINDFRNFSLGLALSKQTLGFVTDKINIKEIFLDKNTIQRILDCTKSYDSPDLKMTEINYPVYIKENTAIFETSGPTWSDTYFARLENGILQINWLGGIIE
ncbi:hypothetical protein [Mangrovibacterium lignilyticum]|uniref:hypothetical protein n=1 Tax=Mangrovibacterium lignilyticum TaxID=2668052 RepID=UPI0013D45C40|nr:hypothetical protein [Mangrovibacterium lignilyticum]